MKKIVLVLALAGSIQLSKSQIVKYSTAWFGPNANPVPEFTDARIPSKTTVSLMGDYYFGFGDQTVNGYVKAEIPLVSERVSLKVWMPVMEHYRTTEQVMQQRGSNALSGSENGDLYVQTRISLLTEKKNCPAIVLNSTLKTAAAKTYKSRRYFDTPGYYFDLEAGKSFYTKSKFISEIRGVANAGFLCWETSGSRQDDAPMYGAKLIVGNPGWKLENTLSGYWGWIHTSKAINIPDYGDTPLVYAAKLTKRIKNIDYFAQYQYGIKDFPFHQLRMGMSFQLSKLTPKYVK